MKDQIVAGAQDAAKELGYELVSRSVSHHQTGETAYAFGFAAHGLKASVEFLVNDADVLRLGLTPRDYARWEVLDALRRPAG
jgi:hypothetical protein